MVNILLERYQIDAEWLFADLQAYIQPGARVLAIPFAFRDNRVPDLSAWDALYRRNSGKLWRGVVDSLGAYGVVEERIEFLNYFTETKASAKEKVRAADIVYFLGGLPDRMYARLQAFDLIETLAAHQGVAMGYSAGAVIQLAEYHLTPDEDYPAFGYYPGIPYLRDFFVEVHYAGSDVQRASMAKVLVEKRKPVYAMRETGAIIVDNGTIKLVGDVEKFLPGSNR